MQIVFSQPIEENDSTYQHQKNIYHSARKRSPGNDEITAGVVGAFDTYTLAEEIGFSKAVLERDDALDEIENALLALATTTLSSHERESQTKRLRDQGRAVLNQPVMFQLLVRSRDQRTLLLLELIEHLKGAPDSDNILLLPHKACKAAGLTGHNQSAVRFLLRQQYQELWNEIQLKKLKNSAFSENAMVVGTAGIGKSAFRFFIIRMWLLQQMDLMFEQIVFNVGERFYCISMSGQVRRVLARDVGGMRTMALMDPCALLNGNKGPGCGLNIAFLSPSVLAGQMKACSVTEFQKEANTFVLGLFTEPELDLILPGLDPNRKKNCCYLKGDMLYFAPRWLLYAPEEMVMHLEEICTAISRDALYRWFLSNKEEQVVKDGGLPFRAFVIERTRSGWAAVGFISETFTRHFLRWAKAGANLDRRGLLNLLENPFARGLVGTIFENWAFDALGQGSVLKAPSHDLDRKKLLCGLLKFKLNNHVLKFTSVTQFDWSWKEAGNMSDIKMDLNVLYRAAVRNFPSIDGYGLVPGYFAMVQMTVGSKHDAAKWIHVEELVLVAERLQSGVKILLLYVVPKGSRFVLPNCDTLAERVTVSVAYVEPDDFCARFMDGVN